MVGQGRPNTRRKSLAPWIGLLLSLLVVALTIAAARPLVADEPTLVLRIAWGGGAERQWHGNITIDRGSLTMVRPLGIVADAPGSIWSASDHSIELRERSARAYDGVDVQVFAPADAKLTITLTPEGDARTVTSEMTLADLTAKMHRQSLDDHENQLLVRRSPGDTLRIATLRDPLIFQPGETWRLEVQPWTLPAAPGTTVYLKCHLSPARANNELWSKEVKFKTPAPEVPAASPAAAVPSINALPADAQPAAIPLEIKLPDQEGVYDLVVDASERSALRWTKSIAERRVQIVVLADHAPAMAVDNAAWTSVMEIEPANPRWYERFKNLTKIAGITPTPLDNGNTLIVQHPLGRMAQLAAGPRGAEPSWQAYPLSVTKPGMPHRLEIDYPADLPQTLGISIVEPNAAGSIGPIGLDSGVYVPDEASPADPGWAKHNLVFWPRTNSPVLLLTNRRESTRAMFGKIRLYSGPARLPRAFPATDAPPERLIAAYFDRPLFTANFSASEALDPFTGRSLTDWQTFFEGASRLTEYLNSVGYNGLMLSVFSEGSTIYPSPLLQPTPRFDTGTFFDQGQDPMRKDVLELVLRLFDRQGLKLIPALQFSAPLPALETLVRSGGLQSVGIQLIGAEGIPWNEANATRHGLAPYYNPLDERVQEAMLAVVHELVVRYGSHPAFSGLAIELSADGYSQLPGEAWGLDDRTFARFERDTRVSVPGDGPRRFADRAAFVTGRAGDGPGRRQWLEWRSGVLADFHRRIRRELAAIRPDVRLYLTPTNMLDVPELQHDLRPGLPSHVRIADTLATVGISADSYRDDSGIVMLRPQRILPPGPLAPQGVDIETNRSGEWDRLASQSATPGSLLSHEPQRSRLASFDAKSPFGKDRTFTWLISEFAPSQAWTRQRFVHSLATLDSQELFDGGWLLPLGQEESMADLVAVYRQLPAAKFTALPDCPQPTTVRILHTPGRTYAYVVNDSVWDVRVQMRVDAPPGCAPEELGAKHPCQSNGGVWSVDLAPYDVAAVRFASGDVRLSSPEVTLGPQARPALEAAILDLRNRRNLLDNPPPLPGLNNPSFEAPVRGILIPGWTVNGAGQANIVTKDVYSGRQALRLTCAGPAVSLRSDPLPVVETGRLAVSLWMKVPDAGVQPRMRLVLEGLLDGRPFDRTAFLGDWQDAVVIPANWKQFIFAVDDLPADRVTQLRFRLDLQGVNDVFVDDVKLFDLVFNEAEKIHLNKIIAQADFQLNSGAPGDCLDELGGYWPRLLRSHVPLPPPIVNAPPAANPANKPPAGPPTKPGMVDRIKDIWKL